MVLTFCRLAFRKYERHLLAMRLLIFWILLMPVAMSAALIPQPREVVAREGRLVVDAQTTVIASAEHAAYAKMVTEVLTRMSGFMHRTLTLQQVGRMQFPRAIRLLVEPSEVAESYRVEITPNGLTITAGDVAGLIHGVQTFNQMMPYPAKPIQRTELPCQTIEDRPEAARRIFLLDTSAHLFPTAELKVLVDWLSIHKINEFHLLLNGDAGWRMESAVFPKLHEIGSVRPSTPPYGDPTGSDGQEYGGYYTQENLRELVAHGQLKQVKIVPAFRLASGASAILAGYPGLGTEPESVKATWEERMVGLSEGNEQRDFVEKLLGEVTTLFPHGVRVMEKGDSWKAFLEGKGSQLVGGGAAVTDLSIYGLPSQNELLADRAREAMPGLNSLKDVYALATADSVEATLFTPLVHDLEKLHYQIFPRIAAFAEAAWLPMEKRKYEDFRTRADVMLVRYRAAGLKPSEIYAVPDRVALHGTQITTTLEFVETRWPELAFDGDEKTSFRAVSAKKGDFLTLAFPCTVEGEIGVKTGGENGDLPSILAEGVLEVSSDGETWGGEARFVDGLAVAFAPKGTLYLRMRVTDDQPHALIIHEVELVEPLLIPNLIDTREITITKREGGEAVPVQIPVTFVVNFEEFPGRRDEIAVMRRVYFERWLSVVDLLGVIDDPRTEKRFELDPSKFGDLSVPDAADELLAQLVRHLQPYRPDTPEWFRTGYAGLIRHRLVEQSTWSKSVPAKGDPAQAFAGGAQTAAFLYWGGQKYGGAVFQAISQDCSHGGYREATWRTLTNKSLQEILREYELANN